MRKTASEYVALVQQKMEALINECNAFETGPIFAELRVQLADLRKDNIYGKAASKYVMHSQYVEHLVNKGPVEVKTAGIFRAGLFKRVEGRHFVLADDTASIDSPAQGDAMGFEYKVEGSPLSRGVPTTIHVYHTPPSSTSDPRTPIANYEAISYVGMNDAFFWSFETEEDRKPGNWSIQMAIKLKKAEDVPLSWHFEITP